MTRQPDERDKVMIYRRNQRTLTDGCLDCGASLVLCASFSTHERRRCCDRCQHPE